MPRVAIAMPIYNGATFLRESLDSLLKQTFTDWQCAINNNQSTDDTKAIVMEYVSKDSRFKYFETSEFLPVIANFNASFERTISWNTEYFKLLASDDWLYSDYLEKMVAVLDQHPTAGFCSSFRLDDKHVNCDGLDVNNGTLFPGKKRLIEEMTNGPWVTGNISTLLYRVSTFRKLDRFPKIFDESNYHADTELANDLLEISDMGFVHDVLTYTRRHNKTVSSAVFRDFTPACSSYNSLYVRMQKYPELAPYFEANKSRYAYLMMTLRLKGKSEVVKWHVEHMKRKLTVSDYLGGLARHNPVSLLSKKVLRAMTLR
jgi:glycosyltransferase involved in cell wall biosynthesis